MPVWQKGRLRKVSAEMHDIYRPHTDLFGLGDHLLQCALCDSDTWRIAKVNSRPGVNRVATADYYSPCVSRACRTPLPHRLQDFMSLPSLASTSLPLWASLLSTRPNWTQFQLRSYCCYVNPWWQSLSSFSAPYWTSIHVRNWISTWFGEYPHFLPWRLLLSYRKPIVFW